MAKKRVQISVPVAVPPPPKVNFKDSPDSKAASANESEDDFEDENDKIVYESFLNWEAEGGISINFQQMLSQQSNELNKEIVELLIQWEEQKIDVSVGELKKEV